MARILLKDGTLVDGTGTPPHRGDLLISGKTIAELDYFEVPGDARVIDCHGLAVAPGFIDSHSHSDLQVTYEKPAVPPTGIRHVFRNGIEIDLT